MDFTALVDTHYRGLYQFAFSLAHQEADASDLAQETFLRWAQKGGQLRETAKVKSWLFTTLYRLFLNRRRHVTRFPHDELSDVQSKLPTVGSEAVRLLEASEVMSALRKIDEMLTADSKKVIEEVLEVAEGKFRTAHQPQEPGQIFVYGREVKDFHSVDYDAIAMLNVSATEELARQVKEKDEKIAALEKRIEALSAAEARLVALEKSVATLAALDRPADPARKETTSRSKLAGGQARCFEDGWAWGKTPPTQD